MTQNNAPSQTVPYRSGQEQRLVCPLDGSTLAATGVVHGADERTKSRTFACHTHGHVWVEQHAPDGTREWSRVAAEQGRLA